MVLLCYLALNSGPHPREALAGLFWGEFTKERARANLRQTLHNLQQQVPDYLEVARKTVGFLHDRPHWIDVAEFEASVARMSGGLSGSYSFEALEKAAALYQGDFMTAVFVDGAPDFESWRRVEREHYRLRLLDALEKLSQAYEGRLALENAVRTLRRLLTIEPWREAAHRQLMLLLARQGNYAAALAQFEQCRRLLVEELNVEPMPETVSLYERVRAARKLSRKPLPPQPTLFVGRSEALDSLQQLLLDDCVRLVTILGLGGVGKSRLALAAAEALQSAFLEGVAFVSLTADANLTGLFSAIVQALDIKLQGRDEPAQQIISYLQEKELLLLLDNFERLADKAAGLEPILREAPNVKILVTSRERLNTRWERPFSLGGMVVGDFQSILESPAGQLFHNTAVQAGPDFNADEEDRQAIHQICQLVEGLPLGIELADAWTRLLSCAQIAEEVNRDHALLATSQLPGPEHRHGLWATFTYSWRMLSAKERVVFKQLSVFRGSFGRQAAQAVADARPLILSALVDKSLIRALGDDRYQMHESLRQFAAEKLAESPKDRQATESAHSRSYLEWLAQQEAGLKRAGLEKVADAILAD